MPYWTWRNFTPGLVGDCYDLDRDCAADPIGETDFFGTPGFFEFGHIDLPLP